MEMNQSRTDGAIGGEFEKGWRTEIAFTARGDSLASTPFVHEFRVIHPPDI